MRIPASATEADGNFRAITLARVALERTDRSCTFERMTCREFLAQFIEGYLFDDLRTMLEAERKIADNKDGHLGYPLFMACAAGIEAIGVLLVNKPTDSDFENSADGFKHYWRSYLYRDSPRDNAGYGMYQLVRNGIAHNFAAKHAIIWTRAPKLHLRLDSDGVPNVDASQLAKDFIDTYEYQFKPDIPKHEAQLEAAFARLLAFNATKIEPNMRKALGKLLAVESEVAFNAPSTSSLPPFGASSKPIG